MKLAILILLALPLLADDAPKNPELDAAKNRIAWLEAKVQVLEGKVNACQSSQIADFQLANLARQEPKQALPVRPQISKPEAK